MALSAIKNCFSYSKAISSIALFNCQTTKFLITSGASNSKFLNRSFYYMSNNKNLNPLSYSALKIAHPYRCMRSNLHSKGDQELAAFLSEEIENEKKSHGSQSLPQLEEFVCKFKGAEVELSKKLDHETIVITANVNDSVDAEETPMDPNDVKEPQDAEMKAKPDFTVSITKHKKTMRFECAYSHDLPEEDAEAYNDTFQITEVSLFEGESDESTYSVSGDIMDGYLYDLLMNYLEERGITNEFADKMIGLFTQYEHELYINLLEGMKVFVQK